MSRPKVDGHGVVQSVPSLRLAGFEKWTDRDTEYAADGTWSSDKEAFARKRKKTLRGRMYSRWQFDWELPLDYIDIKLNIKALTIPGSAFVHVTNVRVSGEVCVFLEPELNAVVVCFKEAPAVTWAAEIEVNTRNALIAKGVEVVKAGVVVKEVVADGVKEVIKKGKRFFGAGKKAAFKTIGQTAKLNEDLAKQQDYKKFDVRSTRHLLHTSQYASFPNFTSGSCRRLSRSTWLRRWKVC